MPSAHGAHIKYAWQHQAEVLLNQANPVQNTWYTILAATDDVRIIALSIRIATTGETLEMEILVDGNTLDNTQAAVADTTYICSLTGNPVAINPNIGVTATDTYRSFVLEGQNVRVRLRKTTVAGAGNLMARLVWARLLPT